MVKAKRKAREDVEQLWPNDGVSMEEVTPKLGWSSVYWIAGPAPRSSRKNDVTDPPNSGESTVLVLPAGGRRVRLFCPNTLQGYDVSEESSEFAGLKTPRQGFRRNYMVKLLTRNWEANEGYGFQRDYDTAARVLLELGAEVPVRKAKPVDPAAQPMKKGGKPADARLKKPVPRKGRRGDVLAWFLEALEPRSIREAMAEFSTTRSNVLTVLHGLHKDHGIGYTLSGDAAEVELPKAGCKQLYC